MEHGISRRTLLVGGGVGVGLVLAWGAWPRSYAHNLTATPGETIMDAFLKIGSDGRVTVIVPQAEMGQGVWTALPQILADELGADWRTVGVEPAPINPLYANTLLAEEGAAEALPAFLGGAGRWAAHEYATRSALMITGGSSSIRGFEARYRAAGAAARMLLCAEAAARWSVDAAACETRDGFVVRGTDRARFAELAEGAAARSLPGKLVLRQVGAGGLSGRSVARIDLPSKVDGSARYAGDVRLPELVYAAIRHGPIGSGAPTAMDRMAADQVPGVLAVIEHPSFVAAVATNGWAAEQGAEALAPQFAVEGKLPDDATVAAALRGALDGEGGRFAAVGDLVPVFAGANAVKAEYGVGFAVHAAIEPPTATARATGDRLEIWMPTQAIGLSRAAVSRATGVPEARITVYPMAIGGGFGAKIENDAAIQAAIIALKLKRPVQVNWNRAEDLLRTRHRPPAIARMTATLSPRGAITGWQAQIAAPSTAGELGRRLMPGAPGGSSGGAEAAAVAGGLPPYTIPAVAIDHHPAAIGIETGMWRSVAHSYTAFFTESFVDECAAAAAAEPYSFRMAMLGGNPRLAHCLTTVTALGGWNGGEAGSGQGIAAHSAFGAHVAVLAEARMAGGAIRVERLVAAADCGRMINPDIVRQQIEGGLIWGLAAALGSHTTFTAGEADARNFDALKLPVLATMPEIVIELVINREVSGGVGEIAVPPVAPAIANALFSATGRRFRTLPLGIEA